MGESVEDEPWRPTCSFWCPRCPAPLLTTTCTPWCPAQVLHVLLASIKRHLLLPSDPLFGDTGGSLGSALVNPVTPQLRSYITKILLLTYLDIGT